MFTVDIPHPGLCFQQHLSLFALLAVLFLSALSSRLGPGRFELAVKRSFLNWGSKREVFLERSQKHIWKTHSWTSHGFVSYPEGRISSHAVYMYIHALTSYNLCSSIYSYHRNGSRAEQSGGITSITWIMPIFLPVFLSQSLFSSILLCCVRPSLSLPFYDLVFLINDTTLMTPSVKAPGLPGLLGGLHLGKGRCALVMCFIAS